MELRVILCFYWVFFGEDHKLNRFIQSSKERIEPISTFDLPEAVYIVYKRERERERERKSKRERKTKEKKHWFFSVNKIQGCIICYFRKKSGDQFWGLHIFKTA